MAPPGTTPFQPVRRRFALPLNGDEMSERKTHVQAVMFRGHHVSGAPYEMKFDLVLSFEEVREMVRTGGLPDAVVDDLIVAAVSASAAGEAA